MSRSKPLRTIALAKALVGGHMSGLFENAIALYIPRSKVPYLPLATQTNVLTSPYKVNLLGITSMGKILPKKREPVGQLKNFPKQLIVPSKKKKNKA